MEYYIGSDEKIGNVFRGRDNKRIIKNNSVSRLQSEL